MSDRTPEQREAARRDREMRRAVKDGRAPVQPPSMESAHETQPAPEPVAPTPEPVVPPPEPAATQPGPVVPPPEPAATQPEPVVPPPEPVATQPEPVATQPEPVATQPEPVVPPPEPVAPQPEPVATQPEPVAPQPVAPSPEPAYAPGDDAVRVVPVPAPAPAPAPAPSPAVFGLGAAGPSEARVDYEATPDGVPAPESDEPPAAYDFETGEHEFEAPAGTRRVSHRDSGRATRHAPRLRRQGGGGRPEGPQTQGGRSWRGRIGALVALVVAAAAIWFVVQLFQPLHGSAHGAVTVIVPAKATSSQIGDLLARDGVIDSSFFFRLRATLGGERSDLRSGVYHLQLGMTYGAVLTALTKASPAAKVSTLTITEGRTRQYVDARLKAQHLGSSYLAATRRSPLINWRALGLRRAPPTLEGVLFPDTYQLVEPIRLSALVKDQITAFKANFAHVELSYARRKHLTPYDVVTIASMVEAEAASARDRPLVASVVYNRLAAGMMLQFDSTTRYATGNYAGPITVSELRSRSRWNTHTHLGLPPTPIDSPGLAALQAAAHPAHTNDLFFFARRCGRGTDFTATYSQFLSDAAVDQRRHC